jgi:hypothetical protein
MIESDHGIAACAEAVDCGAVYEDDVEPAVVIAIEETGAAADGIKDVAGFGSGYVRGGNAQLLGSVLENGDGREKAAIGLVLTRAWFGESGRDRYMLRAFGLGEEESGGQQNERGKECTD